MDIDRRAAAAMAIEDRYGKVPPLGASGEPSVDLSTQNDLSLTPMLVNEAS